MIKSIALVVIIGLFVVALAVPIGAFFGIIDPAIFTDAITLIADLISPIIATLDLLPTTFPYVIFFILFFAFQGLITLVVKQFEKE
jgi:hypothetical protein